MVWASLKAFARQDADIRKSVEIPLELADMRIEPETLAERIVRGKPDVVGFSCYVWNIRKVMAVVRRLKEEMPGTPVILGGPEVSPRARSLMERNGGVDVVVQGEGEETFAELLRHYGGLGGGLGEIRGITFRERGEIRETEARPQVSVERLPSAYLSGFPEMDQFFPYAFLEGSRGCPFDCKYCDWWTSQRIRWRPLERVLKELEFLATRARIIFFTDSDFFMDRPRAKAILRAFSALSKRHPIVLDIETNPIFLDDECMSLMNSGQMRPEGGVQSIDDRVLEGITRPHNFHKLDAKMDRLKQLAPRNLICIDMLIGLPGDTLDGFRRSMDWMLSKHPALPIAFHSLALPGSGMGRAPEKYQIEFERDPPYRVLGTRTFPRKDVLKAALIGNYVRKFSTDPYVLGALYGLSDEVAGKSELPYLSTFQAFFEFLCQEKPHLALVESDEFQDFEKGIAAWGQFPWFKDMHLGDKDQADDVLLTLRAFLEREAVRYGVAEASRDRINGEIEGGLRRNAWCRRTEDMRGALEQAIRGWPENFEAGRKVLLWGCGIVRLEDVIRRRGVELMAVETEKCSTLDTSVFFSKVFPWSIEEFLEAPWEEGSFDAIAGIGFNMPVDPLLSGTLALRLGKWLKKGGQMVLLETDGGIRERELHGWEVPAGAGLSENGRSLGMEREDGRLWWRTYRKDNAFAEPSAPRHPGVGAA